MATKWWASATSLSKRLSRRRGRGRSRRLLSRGLDGEESIRKRLINAVREVEQAEEFQYVVVNDDLDRATLELESIVRARRLSPARQAERLERIRKEFH